MTTKRLDTDTRRKQIIEAVRELIVKNGSEHLTIRHVAREVGISEAAIYRHFKNKEEIIALMLETMDETFHEEFDRARGKYQSPLQEMNDLMRNHISAIEQRRGVYFQVLAEIVSLGNQNLNKLAATVIEKYIERLSGLVTAGIESGELKPGIDPKKTATLLFGLLQGTTNIWAINNYNFNLAEMYDPLWEMYRQMLRQPDNIANEKR